MIGKVKSKEEVAEGTLQVVFEVTDNYTFKPGQYIFIQLKNPKYPDDRNNRRHFSVNNSPNQKGIVIITTRISESGFKKNLKEIDLGTEVELGPIAGVFVLPEDLQKPLVLIAGGIGITPYMSFLRYIYEEKLPYKITLLYSNRNSSSAVYLNELKKLETQIPSFKLILIMSEDPSWTGEKRIIDANLIKEYFPEVNAQKYMVVGPPGMVAAIEKALLEAGIKPENIKVENFTGY